MRGQLQRGSSFMTIFSTINWEFLTVPIFCFSIVYLLSLKSSRRTFRGTILAFAMFLIASIEMARWKSKYLGIYFYIMTYFVVLLVPTNTVFRDRATRTFWDTGLFIEWPEVVEFTKRMSWFTLLYVFFYILNVNS
jgi:hypothetical protein